MSTTESERLTEKPSYYAIIPASVRYDKRLSANAKLLYGEITCLLQFNNKCFASNKYFAKLYELSEVQISRTISQLVEAGYVTTEMQNTAKGSQRFIKLVLNINDNTPVNKSDKGGLIKNDKHNNHSNNINSLSNDKESKLPFDENELKPKRKKFIIPTLEEVVLIIKDKKTAQKFINHYNGNGWVIGKTKMVNWQATANNWKLDNEEKNKPEETGKRSLTF